MSDRLAPALITIGFVIVLFGLMWWAWSARKRRSSHLEAPANQLATSGDNWGDFAALYVSTTPADQPLERLVIPGLGFRGRSLLRVTSTGIIIDIPGENSVAIDALHFSGVRTAQVTIDKAVERDGLVVLQWKLRATDGKLVPVDSYFRVTEPDEKSLLISTASRLVEPSSSAPTIQEA